MVGVVLAPLNMNRPGASYANVHSALPVAMSEDAKRSGETRCNSRSPALMVLATGAGNSTLLANR